MIVRMRSQDQERPIFDNHHIDKYKYMNHRNNISCSVLSQAMLSSFNRIILLLHNHIYETFW